MDKNVSTASVAYNYSLWAGNLGGYFYPVFTDNGRWLKYGGSANTNYDPLSWEYNPVEVFSDPYDPGPGYFDIVRLRQDSAFVNGSLYSVVGDSPQVGFTTSKNNEPDRGDSDLGFHYSNWDYSNTGDPNVVCDFDGDNYVGMGDLVIVANYWLEYCTDANCPDVDDSNDINFNDFARLSQDWQKTTGDFPLISVSFSDGEDGDKIVRASGYDESIYRMFLFVDGYFIREIFLEPGPISTRQVFVPWLKTGIHQAKIIAFDLQGNIVCGPVQDFPIAEGISGCDVPRFFGKGKPLPFIASSSLGDVEVKAWYEGSVVWNQIFSGSLINGEVPGSITNDYEFECLQFVPVQMMKASGSSGVATPTAAVDEDFDGYRALMVRPDFRINWSSGLADHVYDMLDQMGYKTKKLTCFTSTHSRIKKYKDKGRIEVLYFTGHSNYIWGGAQVSVQELDDCIIVSDKVSNYTPQSSAPSWLTLMDPEIEKSVKTWKEIGFDRLRFAAFDACYALRNAIEESTGDLVEDLGAQSKYRGDLSEALNLGQDCFLYGWSDFYHTGFQSEFEQFSSNLWTRFEAGDTLYEAIQYCIDHGDLYEGQDPRVEYRIHGVGDMFNFELQ